MTSEIWKKVELEGYSNYMVSNTQKIKNIKTKKIRDISKNKSAVGGHMVVGLRNDKGNKKNITFSNIVAKAFVDNPDNKPMVWHIDKDLTNNVPENLMWVNRDDIDRLKTYTGIHNMHPILRMDIETREEQIFESSHEARDWVIEKGLSTSDKIADSITNACNTDKNAYGSMWEYYIEEIEDEEWKKHPKLNIECSNKNRVKNHYRLLLGGKTTHGYIVIGIDKVIYKKSRLIYETFNELIDNDDIIDHKDENRSNNNLDNLERVTGGENTERARAKKVYQFSKNRATFIKEFKSVTEAKRILNIKNISGCAFGIYNRAGNYYFSYERNLSEETIKFGEKYRKIYQYSIVDKKLKGEYEDASAAAKAIGKPKDVTNIRKCADGKLGSACNFYWSWTLD